MKWKVISLLVAGLLSMVVIKQTMFIRWFGYETIPVPVADEFNYVWQGLSLRKNGLPMAWVTFTGVYKNEKYNSKYGGVNGFGISVDGNVIDRSQFMLDRRPLIAIDEIDYMKGLEQMFFAAPFFDHPPFGGLVYSLGMDDKVTKLDQVKPDLFRKPALILAVITAILLFIFLFLITANPWIATLAVVIYSVVPTYLLATRTAFLENVVSPISLIGLILLFLTIKKKTNYFSFILSGLVVGLGILAKEPAISFMISGIILMWLNKINKRFIIVFFIAALLPIIGYVAWGLWLQKDLFFDILFSNANRGYFGAIKLVTMLEALKFKNFPTDGWWIWGFVSFLLISIRSKSKNILFLTIPLAIHLLVILLLGSPNYPWYLVSSIPLLAACSAVMIWRIAKKPSIASAMAFFFIPFSSSYYWGRVALNIEPSINHYRVVFLVFSLLLFLRLKFSKSKIASWIWLIFLAILMQKVVVYSQLFMPYLIAHWGSLPVPSLPNF